MPDQGGAVINMWFQNPFLNFEPFELDENGSSRKNRFTISTIFYDITRPISIVITINDKISFVKHEWEMSLAIAKLIE